LVGTPTTSGRYVVQVQATANGKSVTKNFTFVEVTNTPATGKPVITGTLTQGQTLTASMGTIADPDGLSGVSITYTWQNNGGVGQVWRDIINERTEQTVTGTTHTLLDQDAFNSVRVKATFTDNNGFSETLYSDPTGRVLDINSPATGKPAVSGTVDVGNTLTGSIGTIEDLDRIAHETVAYQWQVKRTASDGTVSWESYTNSSGTVVKGASITVDPKYAGLVLRLKVSFEDADTVDGIEEVYSDEFTVPGTASGGTSSSISFAVPRGMEADASGKHIVAVPFSIRDGVLDDAEARIGDGAYDAGVTYKMVGLDTGFDPNTVYDINSATGRITYKTDPGLVDGSANVSTRNFKIVATATDGTTLEQAVELNQGARDLPTFTGSNGGDRINGDAFANQLRGGKGGDALVGKDDNDTFFVGDVATTISTADLVVDFRSPRKGNDILNLGADVTEVWYKNFDFQNDGNVNDLIIYNNAGQRASGTDGNGGIYVVLRDVGTSYTLTSDMLSNDAGTMITATKITSAPPVVLVAGFANAAGVDDRIDQFFINWTGTTTYGGKAVLKNLNPEDGDLIALLGRGDDAAPVPATIYWKRENHLTDDAANEVVLYKDNAGTDVLAVIDEDFLLDRHDFVSPVTLIEIA